MLRLLRSRWGGPVVLALVLAYAALWIWQGVDFTDDGFHLSNQQRLLATGGLPESGWGVMVWGSDLVGAAWLWLTRDAGLVAARAGWAVLTAACAGLAVTILGRVYAR